MSSSPAAPRAHDEELYHRLLALDHSRQPPWGPLHGVAVATYLLQNCTGPIAADDPRLELLRVFLDGGRPALDARTAGRRRRNSHRAHGSPVAASRGPLLTGQPTRFRTTIAEVAVDGSFPAAGYEERVRAWAADTLRAWTGP